jgi:hypothetical protein
VQPPAEEFLSEQRDAQESLLGVNLLTMEAVGWFVGCSCLFGFMLG